MLFHNFYYKCSTYPARRRSRIYVLATWYRVNKYEANKFSAFWTKTWRDSTKHNARASLRHSTNRILYTCTYTCIISCTRSCRCTRRTCIWFLHRVVRVRYFSKNKTSSGRGTFMNGPFRETRRLRDGRITTIIVILCSTTFNRFPSAARIMCACVRPRYTHNVYSVPHTRCSLSSSSHSVARTTHHPVKTLALTFRKQNKSRLRERPHARTHVQCFSEAICLWKCLCCALFVCVVHLVGKLINACIGSRRGDVYKSSL